MRNINRTILEGNATRDCELRATPNGKSVAIFALAVNRDKEVSYFEVTAWDKLAEICNTYIKKGTHLIIDGRLQQNRWEKEGKTHSTIHIVADNIRILTPATKATDTPTNIVVQDDDAPF